MRVLVTGGAGFIGSAVCRHLVIEKRWEVLNLDKLTYAANLASLAAIKGSPIYRFVQGDVCDRPLLDELFATFEPEAVLHLAAESHVDRSIKGSDEFMRTNVLGTHAMLEAARAYWERLRPVAKEAFRFHHISTDEVFGSLGNSGFFEETTPYDPRSPYSASKAASDHLVRSWHHTYGLPVVLSNCSNNYGPFQFPEKLIPLTILNALDGMPIAVYGDGSNVRDWLYVEDHVRALVHVLAEGRLGESYNVGGRSEKTNIDVVHMICDLLDELAPKHCTHRDLIRFVSDRPGHDRRYAIDPAKIERELAWRPHETFETGMRKTVQWYLENTEWWTPIRQTQYRGERLGLLHA